MEIAFFNVDLSSFLVVFCYYCYCRVFGSPLWCCLRCQFVCGAISPRRMLFLRRAK